MLPFMKIRRPDASVVVETRKPDQKDESSSDNEGLEIAMMDLSDALASKDKKAAAAAFRAAFEILESSEHEQEQE